MDRLPKSFELHGRHPKGQAPTLYLGVTLTTPEEAQALAEVLRTTITPLLETWCVKADLPNTPTEQ